MFFPIISLTKGVPRGKKSFQGALSSGGWATSILAVYYNNWCNKWILAIHQIINLDSIQSHIWYHSTLNYSIYFYLAKFNHCYPLLGYLRSLHQQNFAILMFAPQVTSICAKHGRPTVAPLASAFGTHSGWPEIANCMRLVKYGQILLNHVKLEIVEKTENMKMIPA